MKVRIARREDYGQYLALKKEEEKEYPGRKIPENQHKKYFNNSFTKKNCILLFAEKNGRLFALLNGRFFKRKGEIDYLFVTKRFRKKGIATKLIKMFIEIIRAKSRKRVALEVNIKNVMAFNLYNKLGFKEKKRMIRRSGNKMVMKLTMEKEIK